MNHCVCKALWEHFRNCLLDLEASSRRHYNLQDRLSSSGLSDGVLELYKVVAPALE